MKTPEEIAEATVRQYITAPFARDQMDPRELIAGLGLSNAQAASIFDMAVAAIEADRAQRSQIHPDWRDDQENVRGAAYVDVAWQVYGPDGRLGFASDMRLTATQAMGMFQGIGEAGTPCVCGAPFESVECQKRAHLRGPQIALDPEPYVWSGTKLRTGIKHDGEALEFAPRPGFNQNREDYA